MGDVKHIVFEIEVPVIFTEDLEDLREYRDEFESESDWLRNCIGAESSIVRLRTEISGEKDSEVVEVWGSIREVKLVDPGRGYEVGGTLTDEQLAEHGQHKLLRDERACEWCTTGVKALRGREDDDE